MALRKRMSRKELQKTDPVTAALEDFAAKMVEYRRLIILAAVGGTAFLVAAIGFRHATDSAASERAEAVAAAFEVVGSTVGEAPGDELAGAIERKNFADEQTRNEALNEKLGAVATAYGDEKLGALARLIQASSKKDGVDAAAVKKDGEALKEDEGAVAGWLNMGLGRLAWKAGENTAAGEGFDAILKAEGTPLSARIQAQIHAGDLVNPAFGGKGDAEAARSAYREALKLIDTSIQSRSGQLNHLRSAAAARLALLPGGAAEVLQPPAPAKAEAVPTQTASP